MNILTCLSYLPVLPSRGSQSQWVQWVLTWGTGTPAVTTTVNVTMVVQSLALTPVKSETTIRQEDKVITMAAGTKPSLSTKWQETGLVAKAQGQRRLSRY